MMAISVEFVDNVSRHGSWINTDRFPKQTPKEKSSSGVRGLGHAPAGKCFRFLCP